MTAKSAADLAADLDLDMSYALVILNRVIKSKAKSASALRNQVYKDLFDAGLNLTPILQELARARTRVSQKRIAHAVEIVKRTNQTTGLNAGARGALALASGKFRPAGKSAKPPAGTICHKLWKEDHLTTRQAQAANAFYRLLLAMQWHLETSQGTTANYQATIIDSGGRPGYLPARSNDRCAEKEIFKAMEQYLHVWERRILRLLTEDFLLRKHGGALKVDALGADISGYNRKHSAYAAGVANIQNTLMSIGEFFGA